MTAVRLFLVRHGRTELNAEGRLRGEIDVPLDSVGEEEATVLGDAFQDVALDVVVSSPLSRAVATANALVSTARSLTVDDRLRDRSYGRWAGHAPYELVERFGSVDQAPGVEAWEQVVERAIGALATALELPSCDTRPAVAVALVTHEAILRAVLGQLLPSLDLAQLDVPTGSWSELRRTSKTGYWRVVRLGATGRASPG